MGEYNAMDGTPVPGLVLGKFYLKKDNLLCNKSRSEKYASCRCFCHDRRSNYCRYFLFNS